MLRKEILAAVFALAPLAAHASEVRLGPLAPPDILPITFSFPSGSGGGSLTVQAATAATSRTLAASDCNTAIPFTSSHLVTVTLPGTLSPGCVVTELQYGTGTIFNYTGAGATLAGPYNAPYAQNTSLQLLVSANASGNNAAWGVANTGKYYSPWNTILPVLPPPVPTTPLYQYYVNASTGSDTNTGLSPAQAWQTITKVNGFTTFAPGTQINFSGAFTGCLALIAGTNVSTSTTYTAGITVSLPSGSSITSNCPGTGSGTQGPKSATVKFDGINGAALIGSGSISGNNNGTQYGVLVQNSQNSNTIAGITINGPTVSGHNISTSATLDYAAEIEILGYTTTANCVPVDQILIENVTASGTAQTSTDDMGINLRGCTNGTTGLNITNVTISGATISNIGGRASGVYGGGSGNGILCNACRYVNDEFNTVLNSGANTTTCGGPGANWVYNSDNVAIHNNATSGMGPTGGVQPSGACDWLAYDLDGGVTNSVMAENWSYNNGGPGEEFYEDGGGRGVWGPNGAFGNISVQDNNLDISTNSHALGQNLGIIAYAGTGNGLVGGSYAFNNTVYNIQSTYVGSCAGFYTAPLSGVYANNICQLYGGSQAVFIDGGGQAIPATFYFLSNDYYNTNDVGVLTYYSIGGQSACYYLSTCSKLVPGGEAGTVLTIPGFSGTPTLANCTVTAGVGPQPCPTQLTLANGSGNRGTGTNLSLAPYNVFVPPYDYYGTTVPNSTGTGYNIGAAGN